MIAARAVEVGALDPETNNGLGHLFGDIARAGDGLLPRLVLSRPEREGVLVQRVREALSFLTGTGVLRPEVPSPRQYLRLLVPETRRVAPEVFLRRLFRTDIVSAPLKGHDA